MRIAWPVAPDPSAILISSWLVSRSTRLALRPAPTSDQVALTEWSPPSGAVAALLAPVIRTVCTPSRLRLRVRLPPNSPLHIAFRGSAASRPIRASVQTACAIQTPRAQLEPTSTLVRFVTPTSGGASAQAQGSVAIFGQSVRSRTLARSSMGERHLGFAAATGMTSAVMAVSNASCCRPVFASARGQPVRSPATIQDHPPAPSSIRLRRSVTSIADFARGAISMAANSATFSARLWRMQPFLDPYVGLTGPAGALATWIVTAGTYAGTIWCARSTVSRLEAVRPPVCHVPPPLGRIATGTAASSDPNA
jgi:hypothetical protein